MEKQTQTPQNDNQPAISPEGSQKQQIIPTAIGFAIAFAVIIGLLMLFFKFRETSVPVQSPQPQSVVPDKSVPLSNLPSANAPVVLSQDSEGNVNIEEELSNMDESLKSAVEGDFDSADFSDAQMEL